MRNEDKRKDTGQREQPKVRYKIMENILTWLPLPLPLAIIRYKKCTEEGE